LAVGDGAPASGIAMGSDPRPLPRRSGDDSHETLREQGAVVVVRCGRRRPPGTRNAEARRITTVTVPSSVDRAAPVIAVHEIDIEAPLETVWHLHVDVNAWPTWQAEITAAHIDGALEPGASFEWTSYGFSVTSTVYALAERARVLWGGPPVG
jgi:hypothetical protein